MGQAVITFRCSGDKIADVDIASVLHLDAMQMLRVGVSERTRVDQQSRRITWSLVRHNLPLERVDEMLVEIMEPIKPSFIAELKGLGCEIVLFVGLIGLRETGEIVYLQPKTMQMLGALGIELAMDIYPP